MCCNSHPLPWCTFASKTLRVDIIFYVTLDLIAYSSVFLICVLEITFDYCADF